LTKFKVNEWIVWFGQMRGNMLCRVSKVGIGWVRLAINSLLVKRRGCLVRTDEG